MGKKSKKFITTYAFENALPNFVGAKVIIRELDRVPDYICSNCNGIETVEFSDGVVGIGNGAFSGCKNLKNIVVGESVKYIDAGAFSRCVLLSEFVSGENVRRIDNYAFLGCNSLRHIKLNPGIVYIGHSVFAFCPALADVDIKSDKQCVIERDAFNGSLASYELRASLCKTLVAKGGGGVVKVAAYQQKRKWRSHTRERERLMIAKEKRASQEDR